LIINFYKCQGKNRLRLSLALLREIIKNNTFLLIFSIG
jgi:hypothetical protein